MEGNLADQTVRERIRDVEKAQSIAELKQIISNLEFQVGLIQRPMQLAMLLNRVVSMSL